MVTDADVDKLFTKRPEEFTAARNELAHQAKREGQNDVAKRVQALRKPNAVVWLVNQVARRHPGEIQKLLAAAGDLRRAQRDALGGGGPGAIRAATQTWRSSVAAVLERVREVARSSGHGVVDRSRISATLLGAAAQDESAKLLAAGRLLTEIQPPGLEDAFSDVGEAWLRSASTSSAPASSKPRQDEFDRRRKQEAAEEHGRAAARALDALRRAAGKAAAAAAKARKEVDALEKLVARESERLTRARRAAEEASKEERELRERIAALEREVTG